MTDIFLRSRAVIEGAQVSRSDELLRKVRVVYVDLSSFVRNAGAKALRDAPLVADSRLVSLAEAGESLAGLLKRVAACFPYANGIVAAFDSGGAQDADAALVSAVRADMQSPEMVPRPRDGQAKIYSVSGLRVAHAYREGRSLIYESMRGSATRESLGLREGQNVVIVGPECVWVVDPGTQDRDRVDGLRALDLLAHEGATSGLFSDSVRPLLLSLDTDSAISRVLFASACTNRWNWFYSGGGTAALLDFDRAEHILRRGRSAVTDASDNTIALSLGKVAFLTPRLRRPRDAGVVPARASFAEFAKAAVELQGFDASAPLADHHREKNFAKLYFYAHARPEERTWEKFLARVREEYVQHLEGVIRARAPDPPKAVDLVRRLAQHGANPFEIRSVLEANETQISMWRRRMDEIRRRQGVGLMIGPMRRVLRGGISAVHDNGFVMSPMDFFKRTLRQGTGVDIGDDWLPVVYLAFHETIETLREGLVMPETAFLSDIYDTPRHMRILFRQVEQWEARIQRGQTLSSGESINSVEQEHEDRSSAQGAFVADTLSAS